MKKSYIALLDSGVGGLSVLKRLIDKFPNENYVYVGDNKNAPYGNKSIRELKSLVFEKLILLNDYNIRFLIVACNTLSTNLLGFIKELCDFEVYGVFPPVERFLINGEKVALISTNNTSLSYKPYKNLTCFPNKSLANEIEGSLLNLDRLKAYELVEKPFAHFDRVILGCTHYFFIKNKIFDHFDHSLLICSEDFLCNQLSSRIKNKKTLVKYKQNRVIFIGENKLINQIFWEKVVKHL